MPAQVTDWLQHWREPIRVRVVRRYLVSELTGPIGPVLNPNTQITNQFESRWHQPWSEPKRFRILPRHAVVLLASGPFSPPWNVPAASNQIRGWFNEFRGPVWPKKGLPQRFHPAHFWPPRTLPKVDVTAVISANDPPVTDTGSFGIAVGFEPIIDQTAVDVSITEVPAQSGGNLSVGEVE